jgi:hypothetical protein
MAVLPVRPDLDQLRHQAKDLARAAKAGDAAAAGRIRAVSGQLTLAGAQLAIARDYGFAGWAQLTAGACGSSVLRSGRRGPGWRCQRTGC